MIKTLHITAVIAFLLAGGVIVMPIFFGGAADPEIEEFLNSPGAVERFRENYSQDGSADEDQTPALVRHAGDFALYLNPPEPEPSRERPERPARPEPNTPTRPERPTSPRSTANFSLIGTSYSPNNPEQSRALLDLPGEGYRWVRQSQRLEHMQIEEIGDGVVVIVDRSGRRQRVEMDQQSSGRADIEVVSARDMPERQRPSRFSEMEVRPGDDDEPFEVISGRSGRADAEVVSIDEPSAEPVAEASGGRGSESPGAVEIDDEVARRQGQIMEAFSEQLRSSDDDESREQMMAMLIEQLRAARVSEEEAEGLDDLGRELDRNSVE